MGGTYWWQFEDHPLSDDAPLMNVWYPVVFAAIYILNCFVVPGYIVNAKERLKKYNDLFNDGLAKFNYFRIFAQLFVSIWLIYYTIRSHYAFFCQAIPASWKETERNYPYKIMWCLWLYYILKCLDLLDSVFILHTRYKANIVQVYHHISFMFMAWACVKYFPGGSSVFPIVINALCMGIFYQFHQYNKQRPAQEQVSFDEGLYTTQAIQFSLIVVYSVIVACQRDCGYPLIASVGVIVYILSLIIMVQYFLDVSIPRMVFSTFLPIRSWSPKSQRRGPSPD